MDENVTVLIYRLRPDYSKGTYRDKITGMKQCQIPGGWQLIFAKGEPFVATLTDFCAQAEITAATFQGLGGVLAVELGYYHLDRQEYEFRHLDEVLEVVSLHGNVVLKDGQPFIHAHGVFSDSTLATYGGHIKEMIVGGTLEVQLRAYDRLWERKSDPETGLGLIDFATHAD